MDAIDRLRAVIAGGRYVVFFGGAGVSTESHIPDFRSAAGLYHQAGNAVAKPEEILSAGFFSRYPELFYEFYFKHMIYPDAQPNAAHTSLARLEEAGLLQAVITQNIDGLHQQAGSRRVIELHGSIRRNRCVRCHTFHTLEEILTTSPHVPRCKKCQDIVKPDVVLYGESLPEHDVEDAVEHIRRADVLIVGGTSLSVYPAAGLIRYFSSEALVLINKDETPYDGWAQLILRDKIGVVLGQCVAGLLKNS